METKGLLDYLSSFLTPQRKELFERVIESRTRHISIVLEDIYQPHNASAVLRSCDCFGIQDVHIIENRNKYNVNPDVALGSSKWLCIHKYNKKENNTLECLQSLKKKGYKVVATTPHTDSHSLESLPLEQPVALLFGTEMQGLTDEALGMADDHLRIPMYGFTESFNISVSAALCLYELTRRIRQSQIPWQLSEEDSLSTLLEWTRASVKSSKFLEQKFLEAKSGDAEGE